MTTCFKSNRNRNRYFGALGRCFWPFMTVWNGLSTYTCYNAFYLIITTMFSGCRFIDSSQEVFIQRLADAIAIRSVSGWPEVRGEVTRMAEYVAKVMLIWGLSFTVGFKSSLRILIYLLVELERNREQIFLYIHTSNSQRLYAKSHYVTSVSHCQTKTFSDNIWNSHNWCPVHPVPLTSLL